MLNKNLKPDLTNRSKQRSMVLLCMHMFSKFFGKLRRFVQKAGLSAPLCARNMVTATDGKRRSVEIEKKKGKKI